MNIDLSNKDCMKSVTNIGETIYMNICDGSHNVVPWGTVDYIVGVMFLLSLIGGMSFFVFLCYQIVRTNKYL